MENEMEFNENDCCGNGCANCVLRYSADSYKLKEFLTKQTEVKINILNRFSRFYLLRKEFHFTDCNEVLELHYKSILKSDEFALYLEPGQHIMMRASQRNNNKEYNILRPYSPFWWDTTTMELKILVKLQPKGQMSTYINELKEQSCTELRAFPKSYKHELDNAGVSYKMFISQGVAIAAILPTIELVLNNEDDMTRIIHMNCCTHINRIYFRNKLTEYNKYWNYKGIIFLSKQCCEDISCLKLGHCREKCLTFKSQLNYRDVIYPYRLHSEILKSLFMSYMSDNINNNHVVLAGSQEFQNQYQTLFNSRDYKVHNKNVLLL